MLGAPRLGVVGAKLERLPRRLAAAAGVQVAVDEAGWRIAGFHKKHKRAWRELCFLRVHLSSVTTMRAKFTHTLTEAESADLLTTGEVARLLGTSRQHVVDLCNAGSLPYIMVGRHRRVARSDVEALRTGSTRLTRDQLRSLWLSHAVAARLVEDPLGVLSAARTNLQRMREGAPRGSAKVWLDQWALLLDGPIEDVLAALTSRSPRSRELRQNSPFAGVLTEDQRRAALHGFSQLHHGSRAS